MNRIFLIFCVFLSISLRVKGQEKIDLDNSKFDIKLQNIPNYVYPYEMRKYNVEIVKYNTVKNLLNSDENTIRLQGWKKVSESDNPSIKLKIQFYDFTQITPIYRSRVVEVKDSKGVITSSYPVYWCECTFEGKGTCLVEKIKIGEKGIEKSSNVNNLEYDKSEISLLNLYSFKSNEAKSQVEADKLFATSSKEAFSKYLETYVKESNNKVEEIINNQFGFVPTEFTGSLYFIGNDSEEGEISFEAREAVAAIFEELIISEDINITAKKLQAVIDYYESLKTKYPNSDKSSKKIRFLAFHNLAQIYYFLDQPEKAREQALGLIENDYDKGKGKKIIEFSDSLIELFNKTKLTSRHNPILR